jgi:hypothetical protein
VRQSPVSPFCYFNDDNIAKSPFMAVIPEVFNRESILFKKLRALGFSPRRVAEVTRLRQQ